MEYLFITRFQIISRFEDRLFLCVNVSKYIHLHDPWNVAMLEMIDLIRHLLAKVIWQSRIELSGALRYLLLIHRSDCPALRDKLQ